MTFNFNIGSITPVEPSPNPTPTPTPSGNELITNPDNRFDSPIFWLDGRCNTRAGNDHSKKYMENLVWNPVPFTQSLGDTEKLGSGTWNGNFLALESGSWFPAIRNEEFTVEAYVRLNSHGDVRLLHEQADNSGFLIMIAPEGYIQFSAPDTIKSTYQLELNKNYYILCSISKNGETSIRILSDGVDEITQGTSSITPPATAINMGFGATSARTATTITSKCDGLEVGLVRAWGRVLTEAEITANYNELKNF